MKARLSCHKALVGGVHRTGTTTDYKIGLVLVPAVKGFGAMHTFK